MAKKSYSKSYLKDVERFHAQKKKLESIRNTYNTASKTYYARNKRHNLLSNTYDQLDRNPFDLSASELRNVLRQNAQAIRRLGWTGKNSADMQTASVLIELNNEAYENVDFSDSETEDWLPWETYHLQDNVFGRMLFDDLKNLDLSYQQITKLLDRSILEEEAKTVFMERWLEYKSTRRR